jgi:hypothetical protein
MSLADFHGVIPGLDVCDDCARDIFHREAS